MLNIRRFRRFYQKTIHEDRDMCVRLQTNGDRLVTCKNVECDNTVDYIPADFRSNDAAPSGLRICGWTFRTTLSKKMNRSGSHDNGKLINSYK